MSDEENGDKEDIENQQEEGEAQGEAQTFEESAVRDHILQAKCESSGFRFQNFRVDWDDYFTCRTCDKRAKLKTILSHLQIQKHRSSKKVRFTFLCELMNILEVYTFDNIIKNQVLF